RNFIFWISWASQRPLADSSCRSLSKSLVCLHNSRPPMPSGSSVYRFGPFEFDAPRGRLFSGPTRVPLSDPQAAILERLVSHAGEVVSKHTLATAAWRDSAVTDNSLDQAISRLRKTLGSGQDG